eukprot:354839-Chlamydomonas_euryale.AAC.1
MVGWLGEWVLLWLVRRWWVGMLSKAKLRMVVLEKDLRSSVAKLHGDVLNYFSAVCDGPHQHNIVPRCVRRSTAHPASPPPPSPRTHFNHCTMELGPFVSMCVSKQHIEMPTLHHPTQTRNIPWCRGAQSAARSTAGNRRCGRPRCPHPSRPASGQVPRRRSGSRWWRIQS